MIPLALPAGPLHVLCLGAHPDDIEIGCGGTLLTLTAAAEVSVTTMVLTGTSGRQDEARHAAKLFLGDRSRAVTTEGLPDGRLPAHWGATKDLLERLAQTCSPDLILAPRRDDAHQDHRLLGELVGTAWRDALVLHYEIPKWDGDLGPVTHYVPVSAQDARHKCDLLDQAFPSQQGRDWWSHETFLSLMRLRGMECRSEYAEAFVTSKAVLSLPAATVDRSGG